MDLLLQTYFYMSQSPYFWLSMGMTTAVAMFVGAIIYDGDLGAMNKGIISVGFYAAFLLQVSYSRASNYLFLTGKIANHQTYANILTVLFLTMFWVIGIFLGVYISCKVRERK